MITGKVLKVKKGYNPNSSSMGSIILTMPFVYIPAITAVGLTAGIFINMIISHDSEKNGDKELEKNCDSNERN